MGADLADLNKILDDSLALISRQAAFFNVTLVKEYDAELPAIMADKSEFQQVFVNILLNAAQSIEGHGIVKIVTRRAADANAVEALVSDTGRGIPEEEIGRIFDPFFSTKPSGQGTGLGLSIAYGIIASHKGTIHVESEVGKGTTFTVRLPVAAAVAANVNP
jgi:two-component system NtrC family sensor kinase